MDRRDFLRISGLLSAYGMVSVMAPPGTGILFEPHLAEAATTSPTLVIGSLPDPAALVDKVLAPLGGMGQFVKSGAKVVVKPNIGWDRTPEQAANTNPLVVKRVVELALQAGAQKVTVLDRPCNDPARCYVNSGIKKAVEDLKNPKAVVEYLDKRLYVPTAIKQGKSITSWEFYEPCLSADCFINVPVAKHHSAAGLTLCLKNMMGPVGGARGQLHVSLAQRIVDLNRVYRPHLHILDATRILLANGPQGGNLSDVKKLDQMAASTDPVAVDAWATSLFQMTPDSIPHIKLAIQQGLGQGDLSRVNVVRV